jgi:hypothetical protein
MEETTLKHSRLRSIVRRGAAVEKRWHHPGPVGRLLDGWRARREARRLRILLERGIRAPRVIEQRGATLELEWIEGAQDLEQALLGAQPELARRLGEWLTQLAQAGIEHADLHPGNVLIDAQEEPWLIDMAAVRIGAPLAKPRRDRQLQRLLSGIVELAEPAFLLALLRAAEEQAGSQSRADAQSEHLGMARLLRRASVRRELDRWLRDSSRCQQEGRNLQALQLLPEPFVRVRYERESVLEMRALWLSAARLFEHGIHCARPLRWQREAAAGAGACVELALPLDAQAMSVRAGLDQLEPSLCERGLRIPEHSGLKCARDARGTVWLIGVRQIEDREGPAPWQ